MVASVTGIRQRIRGQYETSNLLGGRSAWAQEMHAIATLAGGVAHQFNNALVGITGNIDLLKMDLPSNPSVDKYVDSMKAAVCRMTRLTDQLLAYARGGNYHPTTISLNDFVNRSLPMIRYNMDHSMCLEKDLAEDVFQVEADPAQMEMVLSALVENAKEAIEGPGHIKIVTKNEELPEVFAGMSGSMESRFACFQVEDSGRGMNEETRSRIFEPFFTTKFLGRGLSMAAVYGIVKNHGGWIWVDSEPGKGTTVRIYLPAVDARG